MFLNFATCTGLDTLNKQVLFLRPFLPLQGDFVRKTSDHAQVIPFQLKVSEWKHYILEVSFCCSYHDFAARGKGHWNSQSFWRNLGEQKHFEETQTMLTPVQTSNFYMCQTLFLF